MKRFSCSLGAVLVLLCLLVGQGVPPRDIEKVIVVCGDRLYAYEDYNLVLGSSAIVGTAAHPLAPGYYRIDAKLRRVYSRVGPIEAVMPWVLEFGDGATIHASYWVRRVGHIMEHGSVTLPNYVAESLWEWAGVGTPVFVCE